MEFLILGPLEVRVDGGPVAIAGRQPRALLALLLLHANQPVSTDRIAVALWGDEAPTDAVRAVRVVVSRLRRALEADRLAHSAAGYSLRVEPGELDCERFATLVAEAADTDDPTRALRPALALWRGRPLADVEFAGFAQPAVAGLEEQRLGALEQLMEAELELGHEREMIAELQQLATEHPLRERLQGQLMLALYRTGRQADALDAYRRHRAALVDELGLEPGTELRELEAAILNQDSSLDTPRAAPAEPPRASRRRRLPALMAIGTVAGVITGMLLLGDSPDERTGAATTLGAAPAPTVDRAFQAGVVKGCEQVNASFRAHRDDSKTLSRALRKARTTARQRNAILIATRRAAARGSRNLAGLRALRPPPAQRTTHARTIRAWAVSVDHERAYATGVEQSHNRQQLRAAVARHSSGRSKVERNLETVHAGLLEMGGAGCEIDLYIPKPISLPPLPSVESAPLTGQDPGGGEGAEPPVPTPEEAEPPSVEPVPPLPTTPPGSGGTP
jgi:DNA-binding SARP family transcriptional activator